MPSFRGTGLNYVPRLMSSRVLDLIDTHDNRRVGSQVCDDGDHVY